MCWSTKDAAKGTTLSPISVCFISRCCCFFKRKKKKSGRQKWLSVTVGLGGAVQCAGNSADETVGAVATMSRTGKRGAGTGTRAGAGTAGDIAGADPEREAVTLLRVGSRDAAHHRHDDTDTDAATTVELNHHHHYCTTILLPSPLLSLIGRLRDWVEIERMKLLFLWPIELISSINRRTRWRRFRHSLLDVVKFCSNLSTVVIRIVLAICYDESAVNYQLYLKLCIRRTWYIDAEFSLSFVGNCQVFRQLIKIHLDRWKMTNNDIFCEIFLDENLIDL